jgi:UDP-N-acetylmuramoylalanine--D-glutamate ligase
MRALVYGMGVTGEAVARALVAHGVDVERADDQIEGDDLHLRPRDAALAALLDAVDMLVPSPGVPEHHPAIAEALRRDLPVVSELDLATDWDDRRRPVLAITGTQGKNTVTTMVTEMLNATGRKALAVGNTEVPFVAALDDDVEIFVVEASSFRLRFAERFAPQIATWLNLAPDHLDWHGTVDAYASAKARIWEHQAAKAVAIGNADDEIVMAALAPASARHLTFGASTGDYRVRGAQLVTAAGEPLVAVDELPRSLPHDVANGLAAAATTLEGGGAIDAVRSVLTTFKGLPHRVAFVAEADGIRWYDDSKATAPHATAAAVAGFEHVVLIAGGRNKGLDLSALADTADRVRAVVAIGESARDVAAAFASRVPVTEAGSMDEAVAAARRAAKAGDAVLLSPGCASFDWYRSYAERGDDFVRAVRELVGS